MKRLDSEKSFKDTLVKKKKKVIYGLMELMIEFKATGWISSFEWSVYILIGEKLQAYVKIVKWNDDYKNHRKYRSKSLDGRRISFQRSWKK